jgi:hypothetical protein
MSLNNSANKVNNTTTVASVASVVATTTTTILSSITSTVEPTISATQNAVSPTPAKVDAVPQKKSNIFPIVCVVCGLCFVAAVFFYIYATRNKNNEADDSRIMKKSANHSVNHSSGGVSVNSGRLDIRVDKQYSKGSGYNNSIDNLGFSYSEDHSMNNIQSPYSDGNTLVNSGIIDHNGSPKSKKSQVYYPNPLFEHSRPVNRTPTVIRANERDITDEDVNLNILTQEEIQLLKMKQRNNRNNVNMNERMYNRNGNGKTQVVNSGINDISPNVNVAPFNYMSSTTVNPNELFRRESEESSHYSDPLIQNLGPNIKVETKKVEYIQQEQEDPINKLRNKRMNR